MSGLGSKLIDRFSGFVPAALTAAWHGSSGAVGARRQVRKRLTDPTPIDVPLFGWSACSSVPAIQFLSRGRGHRLKDAGGNRRSRREASLNRCPRPRDAGTGRGGEQPCFMPRPAATVSPPEGSPLRPG